MCVCFPCQDAALLKALQSGDDCSARLRRHFLDLTEQFFIPLNQYFMTLLPLQSFVECYSPLPSLKVSFHAKSLPPLSNAIPHSRTPTGCQPFNPITFMDTLEEKLPSLEIARTCPRTDWIPV